jgi:uncharacterized membrane protein
MTMLIIGLLLFFAAHSVSIVAEPWRNAMVAKLGRLGWQAIYSLVSIAGFLLIIKGYGAARLDPVVLYLPPAWLAHLTALLMLFVFPLALAAYLPGRIKAKAKHPLLAATKIWAFAHLLVNGMLADVLLFGSFLVWAVADRISMKRRTPRPVPSLPASKINDAIAVVGGLALYALFVLWAHQAWFGVKPF